MSTVGDYCFALESMAARKGILFFSSSVFYNIHPDAAAAADGRDTRAGTIKRGLHILQARSYFQPARNTSQDYLNTIPIINTSHQSAAAG